MTTFSNNQHEDKPTPGKLYLGYTIALVVVFVTLAVMVQIGVNPLNYSLD